MHTKEKPDFSTRTFSTLVLKDGFEGLNTLLFGGDNTEYASHRFALFLKDSNEAVVLCEGNLDSETPELLLVKDFAHGNADSENAF